VNIPDKSYPIPDDRTSSDHGTTETIWQYIRQRTQGLPMDAVLRIYHAALVAWLTQMASGSVLAPEMLQKLARANGLADEVTIRVYQNSIGWNMVITRDSSTISVPMIEVTVSSLSRAIKDQIADCPWMLP
jgi:hypothetical protein